MTETIETIDEENETENVNVTEIKRETETETEATIGFEMDARKDDTNPSDAMIGDFFKFYLETKKSQIEMKTKFGEVFFIVFYRINVLFDLFLNVNMSKIIILKEKYKEPINIATKFHSENERIIENT